MYDECGEFNPDFHVPVACLNLQVGYFPSRFVYFYFYFYFFN